MTDPSLKYREQYKARLNHMPWLYWRLKPEQKSWAKEWQTEWQSHLQEMETVIIEGECFISTDAKLFAEPGRPITIKDGSFIGSQTVIHGPVSIGKNVGINHHVTIDGGKRGVIIGDDCRIAAYCALYAFNHGVSPEKPIREQNVLSQGITLNSDVWLGAHTGVTDGTAIGEGCAIGMYSVVTKDIPALKIAAGNPAKIIRERAGNNIDTSK